MKGCFIHIDDFPLLLNKFTNEFYCKVLLLFYEVLLELLLLKECYIWLSEAYTQFLVTICQCCVRERSELELFSEIRSSLHQREMALLSKHLRTCNQSLLSFV